MNFKKLAVAGAVAAASFGTFAAPGDELASSGFSCTGAVCDGWSTGLPDPGVLYNWEVAVTTTGSSFLSSISVNGVAFAIAAPGKFVFESGGPASGPFALEVFGSTTSTSTPFNFGGSYTITQAIPEPETYALMLAGLGAIGFMARRRRKG